MSDFYSQVLAGNFLYSIDFIPPSKNSEIAAFSPCHNHKSQLANHA
jgi:hypothetical protein